MLLPWVLLVLLSYVTYYTGKDNTLECELGATAGIVLRLVEPVSGRGHYLYTDNFYTSPALYGELRHRGFEACGTLCLNRRGVPPEAKSALNKGENRTVPVDNNMSIVQWHDKRVVSILTTVHSLGMYLVA